MSLLSILTICNNIEHLFICLIKYQDGEKYGFAICWNGDHSCHPGAPIISWEPQEINSSQDAIQELKNFLCALPPIYQERVNRTKRNAKLSDEIINNFVNETCPLTDEIIDKIMAEIKKSNRVDTAQLLVSQLAAKQA